MSFSAKVKGELGRYTEMSREEALAQISAMMKVSGTIGFNGKGLSFKITTENPTSARLVFTLLKEHFQIHSKLMVKKSNSLKKNNIYSFSEKCTPIVCPGYIFCLSFFLNRDF